MTAPAIVANKLTKRFDEFVAVDSVSFHVEPMEVVGYLGPNGSGKTTTIRMLLGLLLPSAGEAKVLGWDIQREPERVRRETGYMSQKFALYDELTVWENLAFYGGVYGIEDPGQLQSTLNRLGIDAIKGELAHSLSAGHRQRLALATAIVHRPKLLFLDEPTSGVDPNARRAFWDLIYDLAAEGITIFVTTHYMDEAEYCQRVGIMRGGKLLAFDTPTRLKENVLEGSAWDAEFAGALPPLGELESQPGIKHVALASDRLRLITESGTGKQDLEAILTSIGHKPEQIEAVEPSLEDVFLALAGKERAEPQA